LATFLCGVDYGVGELYYGSPFLEVTSWRVENSFEAQT